MNFHKIYSHTFWPKFRERCENIVKQLIVCVWTKTQFKSTYFFLQINGFTNAVWKSCQKHDHCFWGKISIFRQINVLIEEVTKDLISRKNLSVWSHFIVFLQKSCQKHEITVFEEKVAFYSSNQRFNWKSYQRADFTENFQRDRI